MEAKVITAKSLINTQEEICKSLAESRSMLLNLGLWMDRPVESGTAKDSPNPLGKLELLQNEALDQACDIKVMLGELLNKVG